jgi:hypothetical protein
VAAGETGVGFHSSLSINSINSMEASKIIRLEFESDSKATYSIQCKFDGRTKPILLKRGEKYSQIFNESQFIENLQYLENLIEKGNFTIRLDEKDKSKADDVLNFIYSVSQIIYFHLYVCKTRLDFAIALKYYTMSEMLLSI